MKQYWKVHTKVKYVYQYSGLYTKLVLRSGIILKLLNAIRFIGVASKVSKPSVQFSKQWCFILLWSGTENWQFF